MAMNLNKDAVYRAAKPKDKDYSISDGGGLSMKVKTDGTKRWTFFYRLRDGKKNDLGFGEYPATTLENARRKAEEALQQITEGIDPGEIRRQEKAAKQTCQTKPRPAKGRLAHPEQFRRCYPEMAVVDCPPDNHSYQENQQNRTPSLSVVG